MAAEEDQITRTTISMPERDLARFKEYAKTSSDYSSFSHFLRVAGEAEMNGGNGGERTVTADTNDLEDEVGEVKDGLRQLRGELSDLHGLIETLEVRTRTPSGDIEELQERLFDLLPDEDATELVQSTDGDIGVLGHKYQGVEQPNPGWADHLTDAVESARKVDVVEALDRMADTMGVVDRTEIADQTWYYRRV